MSGVETINVKESDDGMRLNRWFLKYYPSLTLGRFQKLLRTKQIKVDGKRAEANLKLVVGQEIRIPPLDNEKMPINNKSLSPFEEKRIKDMVIYKDKKIIILNKPAGLSVQGGTGITSSIDSMLAGLKFENEEAPKLVHRIDKETSGLLVLARDRKTAEILTKAFREHLLPKTYLAITQNVPANKVGKVNLPIEGKNAQTEYSIVDMSGKKFALVKANPLSGRKHQIRIHLQSISCPIIGDDKYFVDQKVKISAIKNKLYLHAYKIDLSCIYNKPMEFIAPLPKHFLEAMDFLGLNFKE